MNDFVVVEQAGKNLKTTDLLSILGRQHGPVCSSGFDSTPPNVESSTRVFVDINWD